MKKLVCHICAVLCFVCAGLGIGFIQKTQSIVACAEIKKLSVLWLEEYERNEEANKVSFAIKTNSFNTSVIEDFQSEALKYIKINGVDMLNVLEKDSTAKVTLNGAMIYVTMGLKDENKTPFAYAIQEDDDDRIVIEEGFYLPTMETNPYTLQFRFDEVLKKFIVIGNPDLIDESKYRGTVLYDVYSDNYNYRQIFIHFVYPVTTEYLHHIQYDAEMYAKDMRRRGLSDPTDLFCAEFSIFGMRDSLLNNIIVDGKSLQEWMIYDKDKVHDPQDLVMLSLHSSYDRGTLLTVEFSPASSCDPSDEGLHTLELREGIVFPTLVKVMGTHKYSYNHKADGSVDKKWIADGTESRIEKYKPTQSPAGMSKGCGGMILSGGSVFLIALLSVFGGATFFFRKKTLKNETDREQGGEL